MGTWGTGNFDNDSALDWISDFSERKTIAALATAIRQASKDNERSNEGLAAAEVVAALRGYPGMGFPEDLLSWAASTNQVLPRKLLGLAREFVAGVIRNSSLQSQWDEGDDLKEWLKLEKGLLLRLKNPARPLKKPPVRAGESMAQATLGMTSRIGGIMFCTNYHDF